MISVGHVSNLFKKMFPDSDISSRMNYNPGRNVLAICCVSVQVWIATSKTGLDIYKVDFVYGCLTSCQAT